MRVEQAGAITHAATHRLFFGVRREIIVDSTWLERAWLKELARDARQRGDVATAGRLMRERDALTRLASELLAGRRRAANGHRVGERGAKGGLEHSVVRRPVAARASGEGDATAPFSGRQS